MINILRLFTVSILFLATCKCENAPFVKIKQGELIGKLWKTRKGRTISGFSGIPYAVPPTGELRFKPPIPLECWSGVLYANQPHAACPQVNFYSDDHAMIGDEDCLFLNVYTPKIPKRNSTSSLFPVMFYIHGGTFSVGSARYDGLGPELLLDKDLVLVTVNYRLGALGFLTTNDKVIPGNNALKDQHLALKWVSANIINFGGDPRKVTVCGNSAGAISAHYQTLSSLNKGLFHQAILQSGTAFMPIAVISSNDSLKYAYELGNKLNCSTVSSSELLKCLQKVNTHELIRGQVQLSTWDLSATPFRPTVEQNSTDAFLTQSVLDALDSSNIEDVPLMIGMVPQEGIIFSGDMSASDTNIMDTNFGMQTLKDFNIATLGFTDALREFYFGDKAITVDTIPQITDMYTDGWFTWEIDYLTQMHLKYRNKPLYLYYFDYRGSASYASFYNHSDLANRACHTDELLYLLTRRTTFPNYAPTVSDDALTDIMTNLWFNFVQFGNPTPDYTTSIPKWNKVSSRNLEHYHIKGPELLNMQNYFLRNRVNFWRTAPIDTNQYK